jgi:hypothetical protein
LEGNDHEVIEGTIPEFSEETEEKDKSLPV